MTQFSPEQYRRLKLEILGHLFGKLNEMRAQQFMPSKVRC